MFNSKKIFNFFALLMLVFTICHASQIHQNNQLGLSKEYVSTENIFFQDGHMLIIDGTNVLCVKTLHQDSAGMYYYRSQLYGTCPFGHPYTADGGCTGYNCPYN